MLDTDPNKSMTILKRALYLGEKYLGGGESIAHVLNTLALAYENQKNFDEALKLYERSIEILRKGLVEYSHVVISYRERTRRTCHSALQHRSPQLGIKQ
jgi:tetratricopeptide (TPR) repeat protein